MRSGEVVWRDGLGPGRVWPEVNVFLETVSQISDWSCVICHWLKRWQRKKRCPRCDNSAVRNESSSQQLSLSPYSPPLRLVRFGPFTSQSWERERDREREKEKLLSATRFGLTPLSLLLSFSLSHRIAASKCMPAMATTPHCPPCS